MDSRIDHVGLEFIKLCDEAGKIRSPDSQCHTSRACIASLEKRFENRFQMIQNIYLTQVPFTSKALEQKVMKRLDAKLFLRKNPDILLFACSLKNL